MTRLETSVKREFGRALLATLTLLTACAKVAGIEGAELDPGVAGTGGSSSVPDGGAACDSYCNLVMTACTDSNAQYSTRDVCMGVCSKLPAGTPQDVLQNTVGCRSNQARLAAQVGGSEAAANCVAAGPGGNDVCGSNCNGYCQLLLNACKCQIFDQSCPADFAYTFVSLDDCITKCKALATVGDYNATQAGGNSINCRLYHVSAATVDPNTHCLHAVGSAPAGQTPPCQ